MYFSDTEGFFATLVVDMGPLQVNGTLDIYPQGTIYLNAKASLSLTIAGTTLNFGGGYVFFTNCGGDKGSNCKVQGPVQFSFYIDISAFLGIFAVRVGGDFHTDKSTDIYIQMPPGGGKQHWETPAWNFLFIENIHAFLDYWFDLTLKSPPGTSIPIEPSAFSTGFDAGLSAEIHYPCDGWKIWDWSCYTPSLLEVDGSFNADPFHIHVGFNIAGHEIGVDIP